MAIHPGKMGIHGVFSPFQYNVWPFFVFPFFLPLSLGGGFLWGLSAAIFGSKMHIF
jgi:hypothetical protein